MFQNASLGRRKTRGVVGGGVGCGTSRVPYSPHLCSFKPWLKGETFPSSANVKLAWYHQLPHSKALTLRLTLPQCFQFTLQFTVTWKQQLTSPRGTNGIHTKQMFVIFPFTYPAFKTISLSLRGTRNYLWGNQPHETPTQGGWLTISTTSDVVAHEGKAI